MHKQINVLLISMMMCSSLHGMDIIDINDALRDHAITQVVIPHHVDYYMQRKLAMVKKTYKDKIEDDFRKDKKCIELLMQKKGTPIISKEVFWNEKFNKCAWVTVEQKIKKYYFVPKKLEITAVSLADNKDIVITNGIWNGYESPIIDDTLRLYFNKEQGVCCYGYGYIKVSQTQNKDVFLEYSLNCNGQAESKRCVVIVDGRGVECDLKEVFSIAKVMKAFLQSPYTYESTDSGEIIKLYQLSNVILPEEHKKYADPQYWINCAMYSSFHDDYDLYCHL